MSGRRHGFWQAVLQLLFAGMLEVTAGTTVATEPVSHYALVARIPGPPDVEGWDYATIDAARGRLFVATLRVGADSRAVGGVTAFDLRSGGVLPGDIEEAVPHKVVILGRGLVASADGANHDVVLFEESTRRIVGRVDTGRPLDPGDWHNPDFLLLEPETGMLVAVNHDTGALALVSVARRALVGRIRVGGILEEAAAEGNGVVLVNEATPASTIVISIPARKIVRRIALKSCKDPTGIVYDAVDQLAISVCDNGLAKFIDPVRGLELESIRVGEGADGIMYDARRKIVLIAGGSSGTLSILRLASRRRISLVQTLEIPRGTRLGALDVASGRAYLPTARYDLSAAPMRFPGLPPIPRVVPGSFGLLVLSPQS